MTLLMLLAVLLFLRLGVWQWHRAGEKRATEAAFQAGSAAPRPLGTRPAGSLPRYTTVRVQGHYDGEHQFLLENLSHAGRPGYEVLTPLRLPDGRTLLVNRGWVPLTASRRQLPQVALDAAASGEVTPAGRLDALPVAGLARGRLPPDPAAPWPKLTSFPLATDLAAALGHSVEPRQLLLNADEPFGFIRDWHPAAGFGPERHIAYAVQWWAFAVLALALYARLNWQRMSS